MIARRFFTRNNLGAHLLQNKSRFSQYATSNIQKLSSKEIIEMEGKYSAHNYHPIPVVFEKAQGCYVWDCEGKQYFDFLSAYSAMNQGHSHPRIIKALTEQAQKLTLSSRAFYNNVFAQWAKYVTEYFAYERVLPMNTGAEAVETALKMSRKWGYEKKGIPDGEAIVIAFGDNFHGRTLGVISMSTSQETISHFGPYLPGVLTVKYNQIDALKKVMDDFGPKICAVLIEPIQGEAGVVVPDEGYLRQVHDLCKKHNSLLIADEIQTGIARTGKMLCTEWEQLRPDIVVLGKALSGGVTPVSAVLADDHIMSVFTPGTHGSTYGGNPLGCAVSMEALQVVKDEKLVDKSRVLGELFRSEMATMITGKGIVKKVRGKGLLNAIVIDSKHDQMIGKTAYDVCMKLKDNGLLAKQTHDWIIRFAPPLIINESQLRECIGIIKNTIQEFEK